MRKSNFGLWVLLCTSVLSGKDIAFSPQTTYRHVTLWLVAGCPDKPVPAVSLAIVAASHKLTYLAPTVAGDTMSKRSFAANVAKWGGIAAGVLTGMMGLKVIQAKDAWVQGGTGVSTFLGLVIPMATRASPGVRSDADGDLSIGSNGCGTAWFYATAVPGQGPFVEVDTLKDFLEREAGHLTILSVFTLVAVGVWLKTGDKYLVEMFVGALLLAMKGGTKQ